MLGEKRRCGDRLVLEVRDGLEAVKTSGQSVWAGVQDMLPVPRQEYRGRWF